MYVMIFPHFAASQRLIAELGQTVVPQRHPSWLLYVQPFFFLCCSNLLYVRIPVWLWFSEKHSVYGPSHMAPASMNDVLCVSFPA